MLRVSCVQPEPCCPPQPGEVKGPLSQDCPEAPNLLGSSWAQCLLWPVDGQNVDGNRHPSGRLGGLLRASAGRQEGGELWGRESKSCVLSVPHRPGWGREAGSQTLASNNSSGNDNKMAPVFRPSAPQVPTAAYGRSCLIPVSLQVPRTAGTPPRRAQWFPHHRAARPGSCSTPGRLGGSLGRQFLSPSLRSPICTTGKQQLHG